MDIRRSGESPQADNEDASGDDKNQQTNNTQNTKASSGSSGIMGPMLTILVLIVLAVAGIYFFGSGSNGSDSGSTIDGPVARVGGQAVDSEQFNEQLTSLREATTTQAQRFQSLSETRQQELVLSNIINQELLRQAAVNAGASVSESEVDSRLQSQIEQIGGESEFETRLSQNDLTRQEVRENLRQQMLIEAYVEQTATTTDEQVQQLYNQYRSQLSQAATSSQNIPSLEQLRPQLEASIQQRNQQQLLQQARENISVEVLLDGVSYPPTSQTQTQQAPSAQQQPQPQPSGQTGQQPTTQPSNQTETEGEATTETDSQTDTATEDGSQTEAGSATGSPAE
jgi:hypothetical protein